MQPDDLHLIDLDQPLPGQRRFISAWIHAGHIRYVVDPGPSSTIGVLRDRLRQLDVDELDYILLTHIHLDHAGGVGHLLRAFPRAKIVCHEKAIPHLLDPTKLWAGSQRVLGEMADVYGPIEPVPGTALVDPEDLHTRTGISIIRTPGHAPHHVTFLHGDTMFVGEALGTCQPLNGDLYLRAATPPRFILEIAIGSMDQLAALNPVPRRLAFGHYGLIEGRTRELIDAARQQLLQWVDAARSATREMNTDDTETIEAKVHETMLQSNAWFARFRELDPDIQERERAFGRNSLNGILGYLRDTRA